MSDDYGQLTERVQLSIESYSAPSEHRGVGIPLEAEWFVNELSELKASTVVPYPAEMRDAHGEVLAVLQVVVVADDGEGTVVVLDPQANEFVLACRDMDPDANRSVNLVSCGVRGDLVDCFMSR